MCLGCNVNNHNNTTTQQVKLDHNEAQTHRSKNLPVNRPPLVPRASSLHLHLDPAVGGVLPDDEGLGLRDARDGVHAVFHKVSHVG